MHRKSSTFLDVLPGGNDVIDLVFEGANLNPARLDCPAREVLEQLAGRSLPIEHAGYRHLAQCSQCYREVRTIASQAIATGISARLARPRSSATRFKAD